MSEWGEVVMVMVTHGEDWFKPNVFLKWYDHTANNGHGDGDFTVIRSEAKRFKSVEEALDFWQHIPPNHPTRVMDGKPNRPLTAYSVTFQPYNLDDHVTG